MEFAVGAIVGGKYRIEEHLGSGAIGAVYRVRHVTLKKQLALKVLLAEAADDVEAITRFEREALVGAHVNHPNVAAATDYGEIEGGQYFLVLELVRGVTLRDVLQQGRLPPLRAARIARGIAAGLGHLHERGILHRDLKPANIMLVEGTDDEVKLIDFGLARIKADSSLGRELNETSGAWQSITAQGHLFGTIAYMPPEVRGGVTVVDERGDLYALGVMFFEMIAGRRPFEAPTMLDLLRVQINGTPPSIREFAPEPLPEGLVALIDSLLRKDISLRPQSAAAVVAAIDAVVPELGPPPSRAPSRGALVSRIAFPGPDIDPEDQLGKLLAEVALTGPSAEDQQAEQDTTAPGAEALPQAPGPKDDETTAVVGQPQTRSVAPPPASAASARVASETTSRAPEAPPSPASSGAVPSVPPPAGSTPSGRPPPAASPSVAPPSGSAGPGTSGVWGAPSGGRIALMPPEPGPTAAPGESTLDEAAVQQMWGRRGKVGPFLLGGVVAGGLALALWLGGSSEKTTPAASASASAPAPPASVAPPRDPAQAIAALQGAAEARDARGSLAAARALGDLDAEAFRRPEVTKIIVDLVTALELRGNAGELRELCELLAQRPSGDGADALFAVSRRSPNLKAVVRARESLASSLQFGVATPALRATLALIEAPCGQKIALLDRAAREGDARTLLELEALQSGECLKTGGCCLRHSKQVSTAIAMLRRRLPRSAAP